MPTIKRSFLYWIAASAIFTALLTARYFLDGDSINPLPIFIITMLFSFPGVVILFFISKIRHRRKQKQLAELTKQATQDVKTTFSYRPRKGAFLAIPMIWGMGCLSLWLAGNITKSAHLFGVIPLTPLAASTLLLICGAVLLATPIFIGFRFYQQIKSDKSLMLIELCEDSMTLRLKPWALKRETVRFFDITNYRQSKVQGKTIIKFKHRGDIASVTQAFFESDSEFMAFMYSLDQILERLKERIKADKS